MEREKILEVKDLVISFRTGEGKVQAVRDVSFDLYRGETLAIVGESGSGKSVTCKAIIGISAVNAMHENGEIVYDGRDLLQIEEEEFHKIRGDKIGMVFQDPLSALNPIMRTGKQLTEAIIQNNKVTQEDATKELKHLRSSLSRHMSAGIAASDNASRYSDYQSKLDLYEKILSEQISLEIDYAKAEDSVYEVNRLLNAAMQNLQRYNNDGLQSNLQDLQKVVDSAKHAYILTQADIDGLNAYISAYNSDRKHEVFQDQLKELNDRLDDKLVNQVIDFPALAYCRVADGKTGSPLDNSLDAIEARNRYENEFINDFKNYVALAIEHAEMEADRNRKIALDTIAKYEATIKAKPLNYNKVMGALKEINKTIEPSINDLEVIKDSTLYTFPHSSINALESYKDAIRRNKKEQKRFDKESKHHERDVKKGRGDWSVVPLNLIDLDNIQNTLITRVERLKERIEQLENGSATSHNYVEDAERLLRREAELASDSSYKITQREAKAKALRLMRQVGLPNPELHFTQYPFELSGGMRQRVVIAIALCSNPDILICDEPTTALDVTIQAQILELINEIKEQEDVSIIFITHDLGVVANMADRVAVMYAGKIVEMGTAEEVFYEPAHPYTWALLASMPDLETTEELDPIPGVPPNMLMPPKGDAFADRNHYALAIDFEEQPPMFKISDTHYAATWLLHPDAPKVEPPAIVTERIERMKRNETVRLAAAETEEDINE